MTIKNFFKVLLLLLTTLFITACIELIDNEDERYIVTFDSMGGTDVPRAIIQAGRTIQIPQVSKEGYSLEGWYTSLDNGVTLDERWSFTSNAVYNDMELYAKWIINQYTITFDTDGGSNVSPITQDFNTQVIKPQNPTKEGHIFMGWIPNLPTMMPGEDIIVVAQWEANLYKISHVRDAEVGTIVTFEALVTYNFVDDVGRVNTYLQDENAGIYAFRIPAEFANLVVPGNIVRITASRAVFRTGVQVSNTTNVELVSTDNPVVPVVVGINQLADYQGQLVTISGYLQTAFGATTQNYFLIDETGQTQIRFNTLADNVALENALVGELITVTGGVDSFDGNLRIMKFGQTLIEVGEMGTPEVLGGIAIPYVELPEADAAVVANITLPTSGILGLVIEWSSDNPDVMTDEGVVTRPEAGQDDAVVVMTYKFKIGEVVVGGGTVEFGVLAKEEQVGDEPVTVTAAYPGGTTTNMESAPANNAELLGLDPTLFTVTSTKGLASVEIGLNATGQMRIYSHRQSGDGNTLHVGIAEGYVITDITIVFGTSTAAPTTGTLMLGAGQFDLLNTDLHDTILSYSDLSIGFFSLKNTDNVGTANAQIWILSITITYREA